MAGKKYQTWDDWNDKVAMIPITAMDLTPEDTLRDAIARILRRRKRATTSCVA